MRRLCLLGLALAAGCSDALEQTSSAGQVIAVVNSADNTVSFVSANDLSVRTVALQTPAGRGTTAAGRGSTVLVPLGPADSVALLNNAGLCTTGACVRPVVLCPLTKGSGAMGVAIQDDSIAWVANPKSNRATRINYRTGDTSTIPVGITPQAVAITRRTLYVVNANLNGSAPAGPSSISWMPLLPVVPNVLPTISLTGTNAQFAVVGEDSLLYVVDRGSPGARDGKLSIVDPVTNNEVVVINGLGELPGPAVFHPSGRLLVASEQEGILEINTLTRTVVLGPGRGIKPGGHGVAALALDQGGRIYALDRGDCTSAGVVHVLSAPPDYGEVRAVSVGVCPSATARAEVMLKMAPPAPLPLAYDTLTGALDALAVAPPDAIDAAGVRGMWLLLGVLGFEPSLTTCVRDGAAIADGTDPVAFSVAEGGVACSNCTPSPPLSRLPRQAYRDLLALNDARADLPRLDAPHAAAHRRLVARFVRHHFGENGAP